MKKTLIGIALLLAFSLSACGGGGTNNNPPADTGADNNAGAGAGGGATVNAESLYKSNCLSCHGGNLEGGVGPALSAVGSKYSADQLSDIINNGRGAMPGFKDRLSADEIAGLADWLAAKK
ncbi:c-type cytochrome [Paenibacillus ginsengihumi]|uniref:c-type cytochrome n=1 Tax=Paenibacillus ginsengihumi TaxID=431596 RepID=UPI0003758DDB|nr:cytochrome c [Paenibacillus ginsengihumi]